MQLTTILGLVLPALAGLASAQGASGTGQTTRYMERLPCSLYEIIRDCGWIGAFFALGRWSINNRLVDEVTQP
ncbi:hypothetical protein F4818DRAFT_430258 [Hypoxylon cercidicola]|nr:hypothetical protein F4818DRAFT_430258 [Hypoxylon cercidicola]